VYAAALEGRFHGVHRVVDAVEALCLVEDPKESCHLDLVISAHHWAGVSGPDFVAEFHRRLPSIPVLVLGTDGDLLENYPALGGNVAFLRTPVTAKRLVETVGAILTRGFRHVA
jgi:DNA-binding NtrC family response regulator